MTLAQFLEICLVVLVLGAGAWTIAARSAHAAITGFVSYGLLLSLVWVQLAAVDVALAEVAIGGGLTGVLLLTAAARLQGRESQPIQWPSRLHRCVAAVLCTALTAALCAVVLWLPDPAPTLAPAAAGALPALGLGNAVTGVLLAHRALDTVLETVVVLLALVGVWSLAPDRYWNGRPGQRQEVDSDGVLPFFARVLPPIGVLLGIHLVFVGANAPGGKFQGATVLAAMWLLVMMAGLRDAPAIGSRWLRIGLVFGPAVFFAIGLIGIGTAGAFLAYPPDYAKVLIVTIELTLMVSIALTLGLLVVGPPERPDTR